jgi:hypothetical protein
MCCGGSCAAPSSSAAGLICAPGFFTQLVEPLVQTWAPSSRTRDARSVIENVIHSEGKRLRPHARPRLCRNSSGIVARHRLGAAKLFPIPNTLHRTPLEVCLLNTSARNGRCGRRRR